MFMRYNTDPARLLRLFRAFYGQALRLRVHRRLYGILLLAALIAFAIGTFAHIDALGEDGTQFLELFGFFSLAGGAYLILSWGICVVFSRYPYGRSGFGGKVVLTIGLLLFSALSLSLLTDTWDDLSDNPLLLLAGTETRMAVLQPWALASLGLFLLSRGIVWLRLGDVRVQAFELDYLYGILKPLLRDLPADARCALTCNPFSSIWSAKTVEDDSRPPYAFKTLDDLLLDFRVESPQGPEFRLRTLHRRVEKHKRGRKKVKYKGTKHRIAQTYRFASEALQNLDERQKQALTALPGRLQEGGYQSELRKDEDSGSVTLVQKHKFAGWGRELEAADLPSPSLTLKTIRQASSLLFGLSRIQ